MEPSEIDVSLDELENRLDRLRALYEQYFLGIEKIEPTVARKDVDRRFWVLRRTQIRNTARRFRLQVLVQRYNTFQQYWTRICREIENGTYTRHLLKAQKNLGAEPLTWAAKKRLGRRRAAGASEPPADGATADGAGGDLGALLGDGVDLAAEAERAATAALESAAARRNGAAEPSAGASSVAPPVQRSARPAHALEDLGPLDLDFDDDMAAPPPAPRAAAAVLPSTAPAVPLPSKPAAPPLPSKPAAPPLPSKPAAPPLPSKPAAAPLPSKPAAAPLPSKPAAPPLPSTPAGPSQQGGSGPAGGQPRPTVPQASPAAQPARPAARPAPAAAAAAQPARPTPAAPAAAQPARTAAAAASLPARPAAAPPDPGPARAPGLSDQRLRELHAELVATRRKLNQADNVSLDALGKTLRDTEAKLRAQHGARSVDFQVTVKDGKPVVKPLVRK